MRKANETFTNFIEQLSEIEARITCGGKIYVNTLFETSYSKIVVCYI